MLLVLPHGTTGITEGFPQAQDPGPHASVVSPVWGSIRRMPPGVHPQGAFACCATGWWTTLRQAHRMCHKPRSTWYGAPGHPLPRVPGFALPRHPNRSKIVTGRGHHDEKFEHNTHPRCDAYGMRDSHRWDRSGARHVDRCGSSRWGTHPSVHMGVEPVTPQWPDGKWSRTGVERESNTLHLQ